MKTPYVRLATLSDAEYLHSRLRAADVAEIKAITGKGMLQALEDSVSLSDYSWAIVYEGEVVGLFGVMGLTKDVGIPWLVSSDKLDECAVTFLRACRKYVELMQSWYPTLFNFVDVRHKVAQRWLEWCGFEAVKLWQRMGPENLPFYEYVKES